MYYFLFPGEFIVGGDQIQNIQLARNFASGNYYGVLDTYWAPLYPFVLGIVSFFSDSPVLPSLVLAIAAGSLVAPFTYFLVKQSYGRREAVIAAAIAVFYPHFTNSSVFEPGTESIYLLWILGALIFGWKCLSEDSAKNFALAGVFLGLAYLTRPEAFAYPFYFVALLFIKKLIDRKPLSQVFLRHTAVLLLGFTILAAPYIYYLKTETGTWTISAKAKTNIASGMFSDDDDEIVETEPSKKVSSGGNLKIILKEIPLSLVQIHKNFPYLFPVFLLLPVGLGLFGNPWNRKRAEREIYLILFCAITFLGYAATVVQTRYFYILLPVFFGWLALGITRIERWFYHSFWHSKPSDDFLTRHRVFLTAFCLLMIYFYVLPLNYFINKRDAPFEERDAGLWLKENGKSSPLTYSARRTPVFYAGGEKIKSRLTDQEEILRLVKERQVDYVILGERALIRNPFLKGFAEKLKNSPDFELIYSKNEGTKKEIAIFCYKNGGSR
jgi:hypothetical protein